MSITCGNCGTELDDDGSVAFDDDVEWCDDCADMTPHDSGVCVRCCGVVQEPD